jgi:tRNA threonylcarbamoyladenosine biosynthesis protein TsaB
MMALVLAIDTSARVAGVALVTAEQVLAEETWRAAKSHTTQLLPVVQHVLRVNGGSTRDLTALAVAVGPGAFSGLRVGIATAKALAWALNIPCLGVGSLDALAAAVSGAPRVLAVLDAGRGEWYWATYRSGPGGQRRLTPPQLGAPEAVLASLARSVLLVGETSVEQRALIDERFSRLVDYGDPRLPATRPAAVGLAALTRLAAGERDEPAAIQPVYLRRSAAEERRQVTP